jgi:hypothetical protein
LIRLSAYFGTTYRNVENVVSSTTLRINWPVVDPPGTGATFRTYSIVRPQLYFWWNTLGWDNPLNQTTIDVDASETTNEAFMIANMANFEHYLLPREDTFLYTFSTGAPAVEVLDADGVSMDNIWFSGVADISEWYLNMARQVHKSGGVEIGEVTAGATNHLDLIRYIRRPKVGVQLSTPAGKVETLTLTNVRSTALGQHSSKLTPNTAQHRALSHSSNKRK